MQPRHAFDAVISLAADHLARVYAYQALILRDLLRFRVGFRFLEARRMARTRRRRCWCRWRA
jgi:hypothetical protein